MSDYARIADAIRFIASQVERQPTLDEIAAHVHLSPFHFQRLFSRWAWSDAQTLSAGADPGAGQGAAAGVAPPA